MCFELGQELSPLWLGGTLTCDIYKNIVEKELLLLNYIIKLEIMAIRIEFKNLKKEGSNT